MTVKKIILQTAEKTNHNHELPAETYSGSDREFSSFFHAIDQLDVLRTFQKALYLLTGLPFDFVDLSLRHSRSLQAQRDTPFCKMVSKTPLGCKACELSDQQAVAACVAKQSHIFWRCHLGLIDIFVPLVINGKIAGVFSSGQLFYHQPKQRDFEKIRQQLADMGLDLSRARRAYFNIPVVEKQRVSAIVDLLQIVLRLVDDRRLQILKTAVMHEPMRKALDFMEGHYADQITLPSVARKVGLSKSRLSHIFTTQTGMSFIAYLNSIRINWAKYYLVNSRLRISEMAFKVGFGNLSHFNHIFRAATGLSPSQYRRQRKSTRI